MRTLPAALAVLALATPAARGADVVVRGNFAYGPAVSLLQPCGSNRGVWVDSFGPAGKELVRRYDAMTKHWYQEVYVELEGSSRARRPEDGISDDYDALFLVTKVLAMRAKANGC